MMQEKPPTIREAFEAGFHAGCDHLQPPMGPCFYAKNSEEAFTHWLERRTRKAEAAKAGAR